MRRLPAATGALLLVALSGCSASSSLVPTAGSDTAPALPTSTFVADGPSASLMGARLDGTLVADAAGCLRVQPAGTAATVTPLWPAGYTTNGSGSSLVVVAADGAEIARVGSPVALGGGYVPAADPDQPCLGEGAGETFEVNVVLEP